MPQKDKAQAQQPGAPRNPAAGHARLRWSDYAWADVIFLVFLAVLLLTARASCLSSSDDLTPAIPYVMDGTFEFLALLLGGGFLVVTVFAAAYDFFAATAEEPSPRPPAQEAPRP